MPLHSTLGPHLNDNDKKVILDAADFLEKLYNYIASVPLPDNVQIADRHDLLNEIDRHVIKLVNL
jgi:hypothetical protein